MHNYDVHIKLSVIQIISLLGRNLKTTQMFSITISIFVIKIVICKNKKSGTSLVSFVHLINTTLLLYPKCTKII